MFNLFQISPSISSCQQPEEAWLQSDQPEIQMHALTLRLLAAQNLLAFNLFDILPSRKEGDS